MTTLAFAALTCIKCSYPLPGSTPDVHCPECGVSALQTLAARNFTGFDRRWLGSIKRAVALCFGTQLTLLFLTWLSVEYFAALLKNPNADPALPEAVTGALVILLTFANGWVLWRLTGTEPNGFHSTASPARWLLLAANFLALIISTLLLGESIKSESRSVLLLPLQLLHFPFSSAAFNGACYLMACLARAAGLRCLRSALLWILAASVFADLMSFISLCFIAAVIYGKPLLSGHMSITLMALSSSLAMIITVALLVAMAFLWFALRRAARRPAEISERPETARATP